MGFEQILEAVKQFIDPLAVLIAFALTQGIKYVLPTPPDDPNRFHVIPFINRYLLWSFPLIIAIIVILVKDGFDATPYCTNDFFRGMGSGILAAWLYRNSGVVIFGK